MSKSSNFRMQMRIDPKEIEDLRRKIMTFVPKVRKQIVRKGLRRWGSIVARGVKSAAWPKARRTRRAVMVKVKSYRNGTIWCGVGIRLGSGLANRRQMDDPGNRSHLFEGGFRPWKKGERVESQTRAKSRKTGKIQTITTFREAAPRSARKGNPNGFFAPFIAKNRGWRKGLKGRALGTKIFALKYISRPGNAAKKMLRPSLESAIMDAMQEAKR